MNSYAILHSNTPCKCVNHTASYAHSSVPSTVTGNTISNCSHILYMYVTIMTGTISTIREYRSCHGLTKFILGLEINMCDKILSTEVPYLGHMMTPFTGEMQLKALKKLVGGP